MAIEYFKIRWRRKVAWFRLEPPADAVPAFTERNFSVASCSDDDLLDPSGFGAIVFTQRADKPLEILHALEAHAARLLNYDCRVIIRVALTPNGHTLLANGLQRLGLPMAWFEIGRDDPLPSLQVFVDVGWVEIANRLAEQPAGLAPTPKDALRIHVEGTHQLKDDEELIIRRAFHDCRSVDLDPLPGGKSRVSVFRAHIQLNGHLEWPLPYFVKLGDRHKVFTEYRNYRQVVHSYVPFHLGPHLVNERCCLGARSGVIVGDFVEESESLARCAGDGRAAAAMACLFDRTLQGWYRSAHPQSRSLCSMLHVPKANDALKKRVQCAKLKLGATGDLDAIRSMFKRCCSTPVLVGPAHGDLHASNVRVRANDAIVIDFFNHNKTGLPLYDAACLEASLLVDGFANDKRFPRAKKPEQQRTSETLGWFNSVLPLYDHTPLLGASAHTDPKSPSAWFYACVRQIRLHARHMERGEKQYAAALAIALLKKASKDGHVNGGEGFRRAAAFALAERVLSNAFGQPITPTTSEGTASEAMEAS